MKVAIGCEESGVVRDEFLKRGHDAVSCDILPRPGPHIRGDFLGQDWTGYDLLICHPPCTYLAFSGAKHLKTGGVEINPRRWEWMRKAVEFFLGCLDLASRFGCRLAAENPKMHSWALARVGKSDQVIQPWQFGHEAQKETHLWLRGLPPLVPTQVVGRGEFITTSGGNTLPKWYSDAKTSNKYLTQKLRSKTFVGIAAAMADQWGSLPALSPSPVAGGGA